MKVIINTDAGELSGTFMGFGSRPIAWGGGVGQVTTVLVRLCSGELVEVRHLRRVENDSVKIV